MKEKDWVKFENKDWVKFKGSLKDVKKKRLELRKKGYTVFIEPYDDKTWCLVAPLS